MFGLAQMRRQYFHQCEPRLLPSFLLQWDQSLKNWTGVLSRCPGSWVPFHFDFLNTSLRDRLILWSQFCYQVDAEENAHQGSHGIHRISLGHSSGSLLDIYWFLSLQFLIDNYACDIFWFGNKAWLARSVVCLCAVSQNTQTVQNDDSANLQIYIIKMAAYMWIVYGFWKNHISISKT